MKQLLINYTVTHNGQSKQEQIVPADHFTQILHLMWRIVEPVKDQPKWKNKFEDELVKYIKAAYTRLGYKHDKIAVDSFEWFDETEIWVKIKCLIHKTDDPNHIKSLTIVIPVTNTLFKAKLCTLNSIKDSVYTVLAECLGAPRIVGNLPQFQNQYRLMDLEWAEVQPTAEPHAILETVK